MQQVSRVRLVGSGLQQRICSIGSTTEHNTCVSRDSGDCFAGKHCAADIGIDSCGQSVGQHKCLIAVERAVAVGRDSYVVLQENSIRLSAFRGIESEYDCICTILRYYDSGVCGRIFAPRSPTMTTDNFVVVITSIKDLVMHYKFVRTVAFGCELS